METKQTSPNLERTLRVVRRRAPLIVLCLVIAGGATFAFSKHQTKKYTATATLLFNNDQLGQQVAGLPVVSGNPQTQQESNVKLVQLGDMAARTAARLDHGLTTDKVRGSLSIANEGNSTAVNVTATSTSPRLAADLANTYSDQFVDEQQTTNQKYFSSALALVNKQVAALTAQERAGVQGLALQNRAQSLAILAKLKSSNVKVAQRASIPAAPSSPKIARNTILGAMLGLVLGIGLAVLFERFDRRIKDPADLEAIYGLPLVGVVPKSSVLSRGKTNSGEPQWALPLGEAEAFRMIRAHLRYFSVDGDMRTLLVVSAAPGEGKTTVARHLAVAAATMGGRVLVMEVDLRRPTMAERMGLQPGPGLLDVLIGAIPMAEGIQSIDLEPMGSGGELGGPQLDVLVAGATPPPNPGGLIESQAMQAILEQAKSTYDVVIIDTPALTAVSDAFPLLTLADGIIVVGRAGLNADVAKQLHETLSGVYAPLLGVVANGFKARGTSPYGYGAADTQRGVPEPAAISAKDPSSADELATKANT
jgi:succinoglycan biosynthesis transport protein ExoP